MLERHPPIHHGEVSDSFHENVVSDGPDSSSVNRPWPEIRPRCLVPMTLLSAHSVASIRSIVRKVLILVVQSEVVSIPDEWLDVRVIGSASAINSVWVRISATSS